RFAPDCLNCLGIETSAFAKNKDARIRLEAALEYSHWAETRPDSLARVSTVPKSLAAWGSSDRWYIVAVEGAMEKWRATARDPGPSVDQSGIPLPNDPWFDSFYPAAPHDLRQRAEAKDAAAETRRRTIDALGFVNGREAGEAMLDLALAGPEDTRELAR